MRLGILLIMIFFAGCSLVPQSHQNFPLVLSQKSETSPEMIYNCVDAWLQYQNQMILTSKSSSRVYGWNGDKNLIFSVHADGKKVNLFIATTTTSMNTKLKQMAISCAEDAKSIPPGNNFWTKYHKAPL